MILGGMGINVHPVNAELHEIRSEIQKDVAVEKAKTAYSLLKMPVIAEDTGVYFEAYDDFPGAFPSFVFRSIGYGGIMALLKGKNRKAYFRTIVAYYNGKILRTFEGLCKGRITDIPDLPKFQNPKLPYEAIFVPSGKKVRFCRMTKDEKNAISHRARALRKFGNWFLKKK